MKTYDEGARTHGAAPFWKSVRAVVRRWLDRERELISLRNAVGMMSEARRGDAAEYRDMVQALSTARQELRALREQLGAP